mmetsp:Transcript_24317/g.62340  ORF Transcript_24317/g.62340 Transcript_24317/m.62340 type:complete len:172 (-) Transcript_24317:136-651(-)|eukprot:jgi/Tetstr1/426607/TSEL_016884.t1
MASAILASATATAPPYVKQTAGPTGRLAEGAVVGRSRVSGHLAGLRGASASYARRQACCVVVAAGKSGSDGSVIDKPTTLPGMDVKKQSSKKRPPMYKVLLHNDNNNRREYVVKVLLKVVDGLTMDDAINVMNEAHEHGLALVISCAQSMAEEYCNALRNNGLVATIEPDA